ncbi:cell wall protein [Fusarium napiforme]|uniref:Cell wall protein n=1 Tax=Fusarium napiforme TaxID=42672 RepID=A0A8H5I7E7_9HYPO|nr:cell wall protein [Fusarium napiforme]
MKATFFLAAAGLVAAQDFGGQPECAVSHPDPMEHIHASYDSAQLTPIPQLKCLQENIPKAGCKLEDTACQCASDFQEKLLPIITPCLTKACEAQDLLKAQSAATEACKEFAKTAGSGSSKPTATSAATSGAVTVSIDTSVTGSASVPAIFSSIPEESTVVPVTPHPGNGTSTKTNGASTPTGTSGSGSGSESSASSAPTGNAAAVAGPAFGLLAALGAVLAL